MGTCHKFAWRAPHKLEFFVHVYTAPHMLYQNDLDTSTPSEKQFSLAKSTREYSWRHQDCERM
jgi:hypothetical protein